jgi:hypothetical protein
MEGGDVGDLVVMVGDLLGVAEGDVVGGLLGVAEGGAVGLCVGIRDTDGRLLGDIDVLGSTDGEKEVISSHVRGGTWTSKFGLPALTSMITPDWA